MCCLLYLNLWSHFENWCGIVYPNMCKQKSLQTAPCYSWPYCVQYNTRRIIRYSHSTVKNCKGEWLILILLLFSWDIRGKGKVCAIVLWIMMIILYWLCFILKCYVSSFFSQLSNHWFLGILCHNVWGSQIIT